MAAQALLCSAVERVHHLLGGLVGVTAIKELLDGIEQLNSDLGRVEDSLSDADASTEVNRQVRELAYDIEDSVERFVRRREVEASWSSSSKWSSTCLYKYYCSSERSFLEDAPVLGRRATALIVSMGANKGSSSSSSRDNLPIAELQRMDRQYIRESVLIGLEDDKIHLLICLLGEQWRLSVISICGMGGIGKTTLARLAYNDTTVKQCFVCRAWAAMGDDYQARDMLLNILSSLFPDTNKNKTAAMETMELTEMLYKSLKGKRYVLFLDDVWSTEAWDFLRFVLPDDHNGSRIVITTRSIKVADFSSPSFIFQMRVLSEEDSWRLFLLKSGLPDDLGTSNPKIAEIGRQIVRSCYGLPLAITLICPLLSRTSFENWDLILQKLRSLEKDWELVFQVLSLSYIKLPFRLKPCFLYMGHFPPDEPILVNKLHLLWMAEGLISDRKEAAQECFNELVFRGLVTVVENEDLLDSEGFVSGHLHDLIHELCTYRGGEEEFFRVIRFSHEKIIGSSSCRLAVYLNKFEDTNDVILNIPDANRIRSILFFDKVESMPRPAWPSEVADLSNFQRIRVLDFDGVNFQFKRLPRGIEKLIYLRHLSFRGCYLQEFPSSFGSFSFLETLDLRVIDSCIMTIPNVLRKLTRLRHLYFPLAFQCDGKGKLKLDCLKSLEVVENFDAGSCDVGDLLQLENLQILTGIVDGNNLDLASIVNSIKKMKSIRHSSLVVKRFDSYSRGRLSSVAELLQCEVVHAVDIERHLRTLQPADIKIGFNLTEMVFSGSEFSEKHMKILGEHPNLKSLVLRNDAFVEQNLVFSESDFPQLTRLKLATLQYLEIWEVESGAMPSLTILTIEQCQKLEMLPSQLAEIHTLQKLKIGSMPQNFQLIVKGKIQEVMDSGNDDISVTFYDC